ncbi:MAG: aminopeptidase P N-terminal domain-containing protein [Alistipes sp.]|nr:aminopeptidase P N-terminal domain-containing protein [Alistipes sp.]
MFSATTYAARRAELCRRIGSGLILIPGNWEAPYNYPNNAYHFRQDGTFIYYFGLTLPQFFGAIDAQTGEAVIFGDDVTVDDIIWMGPQPTVAELSAKVGVTKSYPLSALADFVSQAVKSGQQVHYLPPYRGQTTLLLCSLLGKSPEELHRDKSVELMFAVAGMREVKSAEEIEAMERAFHIGYDMHTTAMKMCRAGVVEREIAGAIEGVALSRGGGISFTSIVSQHGETLHNHNYDGVLENGRLLLVDAGAESVENYCSDHTRTYPVSGKFTDKQRDIYNIVLAAHQQAPQNMRTGAMYMEDVHRKALLTLAEGLRGVGLINGSAEDAVAAGAMFLFMPHGLSHGMGIDVHDCEAIGERSYDFSAIVERAAAEATCVHRASWRLRAGTVMSNEPGIYFIPALIDKSRAKGLYKGIVNYDKLDSYRDFGGIRIEDDVVVTDNGGVVLGGDKKIPVTVDELEAVVGK